MTVSGYDDLAICNLSSDLLGQRSLNSISSPQTDNEARFARSYPVIKGMLLSRHDWNFANPVRQLANNPDEDLIGNYLYAYKFPSDLIAGPFAVYHGDDLDRPRSDYKNANNHIYTNINNCWVRYRKQVSENDMPIYFIDLLSVALAARLCKQITDNTSLATELRIQAYGADNENANGGLLSSAKAIDAMSQPVKSIFRQGDPLTSRVY